MPTKNIDDWMIVEGGRLIGGYAIRLAYQRMFLKKENAFSKR
jgi:uncharacterized protein YegJ (DUF2314 family)